MEDGCTVVLPTYNEEGNIGRMVAVLREMYPDFYVLVMDDNSKDRTKEIVDAIAEKDDHVRFFTRDPNDRGLSASIFQGIMESKTKYFINMDSDFQHPPSALQGIYDLLRSGSQLTIGIRRDRSNLDGFARWIGSWGAHYLAAFTLKLHDRQISSDIMSGLFGGDTEMCQTTIEQHRDELEMKGYKAKSHYLAIQKWVVLAYREQKKREENLIRGVNYGSYSQQKPRKICTEYPE